jgi:hypothetical protein
MLSEMLVSGASTVTLGSLSIPLWILVAALAVTRLIVKLDIKRIGDMLMKMTLNTVPFLLIGSSEMVWDIGTKVVAATSIHRRTSGYTAPLTQ